MDPDLVVVGSGFFGLTIAERAASELGLRVLVIDRRPHIGGNAYSEPEPETGIEVHRYGAHLFHTSNERGVGLRQPLHRRSPATSTASTRRTRGEVFPLPINLGTINQFFRAAHGPRRRRARWSPSRPRRSTPTAPANLEEKAHLADRPPAVRGVHPRLHRQAVADRPARAAGRGHHAGCRSATPTTTATSTTRYEGLPIDGYTAWLERMADHPNIEVRLDTDFFDESQPCTSRPSSARCRRLHRPGRPLLRLRRRARSAGARSTSSSEVLDDRRLPGHVGDELRRRGRAVHPHPRVPALPPRARLSRRQDGDHARVLALRRPRGRAVLPGQHRRRTARGCSPTASWREAEPDVLFGGRLGTYQYLDMHMAIGSALTMFDEQAASCPSGGTGT